MTIDSTFWVAVSFFIFFGGLIYLKVPQKINQILQKLISDITNEINESEKLRTEAKVLLDNAQKKLDTAKSVSDEILEQAKKDSDRLIIELNDKFHKSSEIRKNSAETKIAQMKDAAIKDIKNASVKIAIDSAKKIIATSVDKSKLDTLFQKNLEETLRAGNIFGSEGLAINMSVYLDNLETEFLPLNCNWITSNLLPKFNNKQDTFVEPYLPHYKIGIMHLAAGIWRDGKDMRVNKDIKIEIDTTENTSVLKSLRYNN